MTVMEVEATRRVTVSVLVDADVVDALRGMATANERSLAGEVRWLLREYVQEESGGFR